LGDIAAGSRFSGRIDRAAHGRKPQAGENGYDADDDQQFDQGEAKVIIAGVEKEAGWRNHGVLDGEDLDCGKTIAPRRKEKTEFFQRTIKGHSQQAVGDLTLRGLGDKVR
jgi:hypothetical protein